MGKNRRSSVVEVASYDLSPEGLARLEAKRVKRPEPTTKKQVREEIERIEDRIGVLETRMDVAQENLSDPNTNYEESAMLLSLLDDYRYNLNWLSKKLEKLKNQEKNMK
jgi:predicted  nucleic acid-binding Zn-ribbon protein